MSDPKNPYLRAFDGPLKGVLRWQQLEKLWQRLKERADEGWYLYSVGEDPPQQPAEAEALHHFLDQVEELLRNDHGEDYCGIVYADQLEQPEFIKIYDPNDLGSVCGSSGKRTLPGWTVSRMPPINLSEARTRPGNRRRWWQRILAHGRGGD